MTIRGVPALISKFGMDMTQLSSGDTERLTSDIQDVLAYPLFGSILPVLADMRRAASDALVWRGHSLRCTKGTVTHTGGWRLSTRHWATRKPAAPQACRKRCTIFFAIVTPILLRWTAPPDT